MPGTGAHADEHRLLRADGIEHGPLVVDAPFDRSSLSGDVGVPLSPLPRGSLTTTRKYRARNGICAFHARLCTMTSGMSRYTVGDPSPYTS